MLNKGREMQIRDIKDDRDNVVLITIITLNNKNKMHKTKSTLRSNSTKKPDRYRLLLKNRNNSTEKNPPIHPPISSTPKLEQLVPQ